MVCKGRFLGCWSALVALATASLLACSGGAQRDVAKPPVSAVIGVPKALFVATPAGAGASTTRALRLHAVDADDTVRTIDFRDQDGNPVAVYVERMDVLSRDWAWLRIGYATTDGYSLRYVLLRVADGKLYDADPFSSWEPQVNGGWLYSFSEGSIVRVDLSSMTMYPMSNPAYDSVGGLLAIDHHGNVRTSEWSGHTFQKIFFADNTPPLVDPWSVDAANPIFCETGGASGELAQMHGDDTHLYSVCVRDVAGRLEYFVREVSFTATGSQFSDGPPVRTTGLPETRIAVAPDCTLRPRTRYLPLTSGFFTLSPAQEGGISLAWTDLPLSSVSLISGEYGYWKAGDGIFRIRFQAEAAPESVVAAANIISWQVAGGVVLFTRYLTGTAVATYRVTAPSVDPELVSSSDMQVQQVAEL
jgi:hypothetical protein